MFLSRLGKMTILAITAVIVLILGIVFLLSVRILHPGAPAEYGPGDVRGRSELEGNTGTKIPASATGIYGTVDGLGDITTHLRFTLPSADLAEFISSTACTAPLVDGDIRAQLRGVPDRSWWAPEKAGKYGSCMAATARLAQLVFVDMTDPQSYIVYVIAATK
jgi:hypothetical protein